MLKAHMPRIKPFNKYFNRYERWFSEMYRVLTDQGRVIVGFVDRESPLGRMYEKRRYENVFYREATFFSTAEILAVLTKTGFGKAEIIQTVFGALRDIETVQDFKEGYGEGGFVVIMAAKA